MITSLEKQRRELECKFEDIGIRINPNIGIGDGLQFSSLPENFFRAKKRYLTDLSRPWFFDHNPYLIQDDHVPAKIIELWNHPKSYEWPKPKDEGVYLSNAEIHCKVIGFDEVSLRRPRLYQYEHFPFKQREMIIIQPEGVSHGKLPLRLMQHIWDKYGSINLRTIGSRFMGITHIETKTLWDLAKVISEARMLICPDSGPAWIGACYPDVIVKKIRLKFQGGYCEPKDWVPLNPRNIHSFWDDQGLFQIYNTEEQDVGFTHSYLRL